MSGLTFIAPPRIAADAFARVLATGASPAAPDAAALYAICAGHGLDPAVALAFFAHESRYGTRGVAARSRNWGNLRRGRRAYAVADGFAYYRAWPDSLRDWCDLIIARYVAQGLATVELALPVYAPSSDGNAPARYVAIVRALVASWSAEIAELGPVTRTVQVDGARVRRAPAFGDNVVATYARGKTVAGLLVEGAAYRGSRQWLQLAEGCYMHTAVLG